MGLTASSNSGAILGKNITELDKGHYTSTKRSFTTKSRLISSFPSNSPHLSPSSSQVHFGIFAHYSSSLLHRSLLPLQALRLSPRVQPQVSLLVPSLQGGEWGGALDLCAPRIAHTQRYGLWRCMPRLKVGRLQRASISFTFR